MSESESFEPTIILPNIEQIMREDKTQDEREIRNIRAAQEHLSSIGITKDSVAVAIGSGSPGGPFWPALEYAPVARPSNDTKLLSHLAWERLIYDTGAKLHIYEPSLKANHNWRLLKSTLPEGSLVLPFGEKAYIENTELPNGSVDLVTAVNLFGTPMLITDEEQSEKIIEKVGDLLKVGGHLITMDAWSNDQKRSREMVHHLSDQGIILKPVARYEKGGEPWVSYQRT